MFDNNATRQPIPSDARERYVAFDHISEKMREVEFFFKGMEHLHNAHVQHVVARARPAFDAEGNQIARAFQYHFSAYLSAHRAVRYYIIRVSGKVPDTAEWRERIDNDLAMEALHHLRDVDIHDETLNMSNTMNFKTLDDGQGELSTSGLMLHRGTLVANKRLKKRPEVINFLADRPIMEIAEHGISSLKAIVEEGKRLGYLTAQKVYF